MPTRVAVILFLLIAGGFALDLYHDWGYSLFVARTLLDVMNWLAFWR